VQKPDLYVTSRRSQFSVTGYWRLTWPAQGSSLLGSAKPAVFRWPRRPKAACETPQVFAICASLRQCRNGHRSGAWRHRIVPKGSTPRWSRGRH